MNPMNPLNPLETAICGYFGADSWCNCYYLCVQEKETSITSMSLRKS